jgi:CRISPR/Cas system-associated protein Csm6
MPTSRPRLTVYLDEAVYEQLIEYQANLGFKTLSKAANEVLKEYFDMLAVRSQEEEKETLANVKRELGVIRSEFNQRIEALEEKLRRLERRNERSD